MAEAAVTFLLEQVTGAVVEYKNLISGAEKEFENLKDDLDTLKAFLKAAAAKRSRDNYQLRALEKRIRKVVYEVEDTIDTCLTKAIEADAKIKNSRRPAFLHATPNRFSLAREVKTIRDDKVQPLLKDPLIVATMVEVARGSGAAQDPSVESKMDTPITQTRVVGFEDEERTITGYLREATGKLDVISIVGIPGQGKTTLALKIYHNEQIGYDFPIRIWIPISQVFNRRDVFLQIVKKFTPSQDTSSLTDDELVQIARSCLEKETFLLVLDDVWSVEAWDKIKVVLPENNGQGKVLITSRETDVGTRAGVDRAPHTLRFLTPDESWILLQYEVFSSLNKCPPELQAIGERIAIKCDGVPLTIIVIGGILKDQFTKSPLKPAEEWEMVSRNVSEALQGDKTQRITDVVALSYHRLPDDLKECFVYLGVFPEDYEIPAKMLCGLWISEGFILPKNGRRSLEESAEENMNDLIRRNLLKAEKSNDMGKVKTCRVHDMIRTFCISKSEDENIYEEVKRTKEGELEPSVSKVQMSHRLCFRADLSTFLAKKPVGPHVRSLLCFYDRPVDLAPDQTSLIPDGFQKLRILESKCIRFDRFPNKVTKLIHLRYLTLCIDTLKDLPDQLTLLWNLLSLVIETKSRTINMKANMWKMIRLRYLKTKAALLLDKKWTGDAGQNLHSLSRLAPESCTEIVSQKAKNLRTLGISGKLTNIFDTKFLENLRSLEKLKLVNSLAYEQTPDDVLPGLPRRNCFPPNLRRLTLTNTSLNWQHMSTLAMIRTLEVLKLRDNAFVGVSWTLGHDDFPDLQLLHMVNITDLVLWVAPVHAFPKLRCLVVKNCENLKEIPENLGTHLEKLEIERLRLSAVKSAEKIGETKKEMPRGKFNLIIGPGCGIK